MKIIATAILAAFSASAYSQYAFENKKAEKLYNKLDEAYLDYEYTVILDREEDATEYFLSKEDTVAANMYSFLGEAYYFELGELQKALDYYSKELDLREKLNDESDLGTLFFNIANIQSELGYYDKAEEVLVQLKESSAKKSGKDSEEYYNSSMALAELYINLENPEKGLDELSDLKRHTEKNTLSYVGILKSVADVYTIRGSFRKAEKNYQDALSMAYENGLDATFEFAATLSGLGILYLENGKLPEAEDIFNESIGILNRIQGENDDAVASVKANLAQLHMELGDFEKSQEIQLEVIEEDKEYFGEDSFVYGQGLYSLGLIQLELKDYTKAESTLQKAKKIFESSGIEDLTMQGRVESTLSRLFYETGDVDSALDYGQKAIKTYEASLGKDHPETAFPYFNLANAHLGYEETDKAEPLALRSYNIRKKKLGDKHPFFARSANQLAIINWKKGNTKEALKYYKETFANYFGQINAFFPVLTEEEKATFYYTNLKPAFEQYVSFIEETSSEDKELLGEIYDYQLALKGLIMYATSKVRENIFSSGNEALIAKYEEWINQKEQMAKLFSATDMDLVIRNKKIDSLILTSNQLEEELSKSSQVFGDNFASKKLSWRDIQKTLNPGEAAVEMVRYRDFVTDSAGVFSDEVHYAALIVRHDTEDYPEMVILRNGKQMEKKFLANYRNAIRFKVSENYSYKLFWEPISRRLDGISKIYFAPDGVYNQISIYTLQNSETKNYLLDEIDLALVTNTKDLLAETTSFEPGGRSVFFGFPEYNMGAEKSKSGNAEDRGMKGSNRGSRSGSGGSLGRGASIPRGVRGNLVRYMRSFNGLAMLPGTKKEVELIDSLYTNAGKSAKSYFLDEALEGRLKEVNNPNILHIATHGFFLELDPDEKSEDTYSENPLLRSGLILAGANNYIATGEITNEQNGDDGILTAYEAMNMNLDQTDVVVLSACETGLGEIKNGEGVYGLQRAFQIAGADAIIMSMWTVDDNATQELMTVFYEEWLGHGDKQKAFNSAQKRIRDKYKKPYYWGAFVMIGE